MMKTVALTLLAAMAFALPASAGDDHKHDKKQAGPNGGRVITTVEPHAEFFVKPDGKVQITFLDDDFKKVPVAEQVVKVTSGDRSSPTKLEFTKEGDVLVSDKTVPEGKALPTVVQIKNTPAAKTVTEKFNLNMAKCPECGFAEYACVCEHEHSH